MQENKVNMKTGSGGRFASTALVCVHCRGAGIQTRCPGKDRAALWPLALGDAPALQMLLRLQPVDWAAPVLAEDSVHVLQPELSSTLLWLLHYLRQLLNWLLKWQLPVLTRLWQALLRATLHAPCPGPSPGSASHPAVPPSCSLRLGVPASPFSFKAEHSPCQGPPSCHPRHKRKGSPMPLFQVGKDIQTDLGTKLSPARVTNSLHNTASWGLHRSALWKVPRIISICLSSWNL